MTNEDIKLIKDELLTNKDISNYDKKVILHLVNELRNEKLNDISNISYECKIADNTNVTDDRINRLLYIVTPGLYENPILNVICMGPSRFLTVIPLIIYRIK